MILNVTDTNGNVVLKGVSENNANLLQFFTSAPGQKSISDLGVGEFIKGEGHGTKTLARFGSKSTETYFVHRVG